MQSVHNCFLSTFVGEKKLKLLCKRVIKSQRVSHRRWPLDPPKHAFKMLTVIQQSFLFFGCTRMVAVSKWTTSACCFPSGRVCPDFTLGEPSDQTCTHTCTDVPLNSINNELPLSCLPLISPPAPAFSFCLLFMTRLLRIHSIYGFSYAVWRNSITHLICLAKRFLPPGSRSDALGTLWMYSRQAWIRVSRGEMTMRTVQA